MYTADWQTGSYTSDGGYAVMWRVLDENGEQIDTLTHTFAHAVDAFAPDAGQVLVDAEYNTDTEYVIVGL